MKIAHLSDLHIGYASGSVTTSEGVNVREQDGYNALKELVAQVVDHEVDAVVIGGDIFHTPTPSIRSIIEVQQAFRTLALANIPVYALTGNHDTNDIKADVSAALVIRDEDRKIYSHAEPYKRYEIADNVFVHLISHHMFSAQSDTMKQVKPVEGAINILSTHGSVVDPILKIQLKAAQSPREVVIPDFLLLDNRWDCVMLGHIHERGFVGSSEGNVKYNGTPILYNGSLIRRGFSDDEGDYGRGWTLWTIDSNGTFDYEFFYVAQRPQYDLPVIDGDGLSGAEITEQLVANVSAAMEQHSDYTVSTAPIVRQRLVNVTHAQKSGIAWSAISSDRSNMLSWQYSVRNDSLYNDREVGSTFGTDVNSTDNAHGHDADTENSDNNDNNNGTVGSEGKRSTVAASRSGNLVTDFSSWAGVDSNVSAVTSGMDKKKSARVIDYSREKISDAYNRSLAEDDN